jgi:4-hydroxythreonine-4-phosphate dehydrogenase
MIAVMKMNNIKRIAITPGEPAGIGPDLVLTIAQQDWPHQLVICGNRTALEQRAKQLKLSINIENYDVNTPARSHRAGTLIVDNIELGTDVIAGQLNEVNGHYVLETLTRAAQGNMDGEFDAVVTGPVHKGVINRAGVAFSGHTEFFAELSNTQQVVMMLATEGLRVALVTTHIPLAYVAKAITDDRLKQVIRILHQDLITKFGIINPAIFVCGLNPHAGEDGCLGREEIDIIAPALNELREEEGMNLIGPLLITALTHAIELVENK